MTNKAIWTESARGAVSPKQACAVLFSVLLSMNVPLATAQERDEPIPNFDIAKSCASVSHTRGCIEIETRAKADLTAKWPRLTKARQAQCAKIGAQQGNSYVASLGCANGQ